MLKKQYLISGVILLLAVALILVYFLFLREEAPVTETDPFFVLTDEAKAQVDTLRDDVRIVLLRSETEIAADALRTRMRSFLELYPQANDAVSLEYGSLSDWPDAPDADAIVFAGKAETVYVRYDDLYKKLENGTAYAFDGERLFTAALLKADGLDAAPADGLALRALDGYDTDGDTVGTGNRAFIYPNISRSDVQSIKIRNESGSYEAYRNESGTFYFRNAELCGYDSEKFASFMVNCTYMLSLSKISDPLALSEYGLDSEEDALAVIEVLQTNGAYHKILVGNKLANGSGYYAKYDTKDFVYVIDTQIENDVLLPLVNMLQANLVYGISQQSDLYGVDNILLKKYNYEEGGADTDVVGMLITKIEASSNLELCNAKQTVGGVLLNKKNFTASSTSAWKESDELLGFTSSNGKSVYIDLELENYAEDGKYSVAFGLVYDSKAGAVKPNAVRVQLHTGDGFLDEGGVTLESFEQTDGSYKRYELSFESASPVRWVRVYFDLPDSGYVVLDELTPYASGKDAIPEDTVTSIWKLVSPVEYIPSGKNFAYPDATAFNEFVYGMTTLVGDRVVEYNLDVALLEKYGLTEPELGASYTFNGYTVYLWFSEKNESGNRYCYSSIVGKDDSGEEVTMSTDIIAEISPETAPWLEYDALTFLDPGIFSMYINKIDEITMSYGGNDYVFALTRNDAGEFTTVTCNGQTVDTQNFRYLYVSILNLKLEGEYSESDSQPVEMFRLTVKSGNRTDEIVFYQVSSAKAYYTRNGEGRYYMLVDGITKVQRNIQLLLSGQPVPSK